MQGLGLGINQIMENQFQIKKHFFFVVVDFMDMDVKTFIVCVCDFLARFSVTTNSHGVDR